jgi:hypothetical protein
MSVWAAPFGPTPPEDEVYLNLYYGTDNALYLEQSEVLCVKNMPYSLNLDETPVLVTCIASEKIGDSFKETYNKVIKMTGSGSTSESRWKPKNANPLQFQSTVLKLASDIDLKGFDADGKNCSETKTHDPLDFYGATLDGLNHTISNFCRADNGHMDQSFGLFSELAGKTVQNLTISNVDYKVTDKQPEYAPASNDAGDYQPAGALAPTIFNSTIKNIKLEKISIQAPLAGGLAGYTEDHFDVVVSIIDLSVYIADDIEPNGDYDLVYEDGSEYSRNQGGAGEMLWAHNAEVGTEAELISDIEDGDPFEQV